MPHPVRPEIPTPAAPRHSRAAWRGLARAGLRAALPLAAVGLLAFAGCATSSTALSYTPFTGIEVSSSVLAPRGCGTEAGQVYAYVVVLASPSDAGPHLGPLPDGGVAAYASAYRCYASGAFVSVAAAPNGDPTVGLWIYAYDRAAFAAASAAVPALDCDPAEVGVATCPLTSQDIAALLTGGAVPPTYSTACSAIPESGDHVQAVCGTLERPDRGDAGGAAGDALPASGEAGAARLDAGAADADAGALSATSDAPSSPSADASPSSIADAPSGSSADAQLE